MESPLVRGRPRGTGAKDAPRSGDGRPERARQHRGRVAGVQDEALVLNSIGAPEFFGILPLFDRKIPDDERLERVWDNRVLMVFGGPYIGRLAYAQLVYEFDTR